MEIQTRYVFAVSYILPVADLIMLNILYFLARNYSGGFPAALPEEAGRNCLIVCNLIWMFTVAVSGLYTVTGNQKVSRLYTLAAKSLLLHFSMFMLYLYIPGNTHISVMFVLLLYLLFMLFFFASRLFMHRDRSSKKVAILGSGSTALRFSSFLQNQRNLDFYGFLDEDDGFNIKDDVPRYASMTEKFSDAAKSGVTDVYVALSPERMDEANALVSEAERHCVRLKFIPDLSGSLNAPYKMSYLGNQFPVITLTHEPLEDLRNRFFKRLFDITFSLTVIVLVFSWLFPFIALAICINSRGPVFFRQLRSGRNDQPFWCLKFRTMYVNAESDSRQATRNDHRVSAVGRFLRKTSLDELPQFFNVLSGEMSVVGPRPHMLRHTAHYKALVNRFMVRHFLKPGITGWAQVNGFRGETRAYGDMENRVRCDIYYLENWTVRFDLLIILKTVTNIWKGEHNAY